MQNHLKNEWSSLYLDIKIFIFRSFSLSFLFNMMYRDSTIQKKIVSNCIVCIFSLDTVHNWQRRIYIYIYIKVWKHFLWYYSTLAFVAVAWCGITPAQCTVNSPLSNVFSLSADTVFLKCLCSPSLYSLANILLTLRHVVCELIISIVWGR